MTEAERFLTEAQHAWLQHIRACDEAGITMQAYAAKHVLNLDAFYAAK